jgi:flagellar L-ring protein precursor FlgH
MSARIARLVLSFTVLLAPGLFLAGCASVAEPPPLVPFEPVRPADRDWRPSPSGSLFIDGRGDNLFGRQRDYKVGDIITVLLNEETQASRVQHTTVERKSTSDVLPSIQGALTNVIRPAIGQNLSNVAGQANLGASDLKSDGSGDHGQRATLSGAIAVSVIEVMANGNLVVRGEKQLALSEGSEVIRVSGVVRVEDIAPNGTVTSRRLASAQFAYRGSGDMAAVTSVGWGTRVLGKFWPF